MNYSKNTYLPEGRLIETEQNKAIVKSLALLYDAAARGKIIEGRVSVCDSSHNLIVDLPCVRGIIPRSEGAMGIAEGTVRDIALISRVNKPVCFVVTDITIDTDGKPLAYLSRRKAQEKCREEYTSRLVPGDIIEARTTHLEPFGAFCDIGCGIASLIPIDCISVSRISHPRDRFNTGDDIFAVVQSIDEGGRINLTHKELLGSWEQNANIFSQGETVSGIVRMVEDYGCFVELAPNLAGLAEPKEGVMPGQHAAVYIKSILPERMKIKLIIIDAFDAEYTHCDQKYFFEGDHIASWQYSPDCCSRYIGTAFE